MGGDSARRRIRHKGTRQRAGLTKRAILGIICLIGSALCATCPFVFMVLNAHDNALQADTHTSLVEQEQKKAIEAELAEAHEYNQQLAKNPERPLGEVPDPWNPSTDEPMSEQDQTYRSQIDIPSDGIMAFIKYPRLGINLPIRHGTSTQVLEYGAGHLYGSSLPVGGKSTHSVISAHTGLADKLMFDRLSLREGKIGDVFYISVLGKTLAYEVDDITVITPDNTSWMTITPGKDLVTLLTCTPYGVNSHRLLVTGHRVSMPVPAPYPENAPQDSTQWILLVYVALIWLLFGVIIGRYIWVRMRRHREQNGSNNRISAHARVSGATIPAHAQATHAQASHTTHHTQASHATTSYVQVQLHKLRELFNRQQNVFNNRNNRNEKTGDEG